MRVLALAFHDIAGNGWQEPARAGIFSRVTAAELERMLRELRQRGYQTASSRAFREWQRGRHPLPERAVVLTFDHGYASHFEVATSLLRRYRFSGTFFITVGRVGQPEYMTWDQLRTLVFLGMEIGSRGLSPEPLTRLSRPKLEASLTESKRLLEQRLGVPIRALAAPAGAWSPSVAAAARQAGYDAVWASTVGTNGLETNPQALRRITVRRPFATEHIVAMVEGWQPSFWWAANQQAAIRMLKRLLGTYWYERLKCRVAPNA